MKTMLDIVSEFAYEQCQNNLFIDFYVLFEKVESELKTKWQIEADEKNKEYSEIRINKLGELYRLLTVDSNFIRNEKGEWSIRPGFKVK